MKITWVTRSFLDYRIPVYREINRLCGDQLSVIYYADVVPQRCQDKLKSVLNERAIGLSGEVRLSGKKYQPISSVKTGRTRIPFQPGLVRSIKDTKPDLVISDGFFQWTYAALWLRLIRGIPHLMCYEGTPHTERSAGRIKRTYRKSALNLIDHIACNGSFSMAYIKSLRYSEDKISLGNMAADTELLQKQAEEFSTAQREILREKLGLHSRVFLFIGRLVPLKGIDNLVIAWSKIHATNNTASLLIVGDGSERDVIERLCTKEGLKNVHLVGEIDYENIYQYLAVSDMFVMPTLQDNWSLVVPEAMSVGLPVLCSKYNGCWPELVKPENGWVFDPLDPDDFMQTLEKAWEKRSDWEAMGRKSLEIVQDFTPRKIANDIFNACLSLSGK